MNEVLRLQRASYRSAELILNGSLWLKDEIERILTHPDAPIADLSRRQLTLVLEQAFRSRGWHIRARLNREQGAKIDFLKDRVGMEIEFGHPNALAMSLLKFQTASPAGLDLIDVGVYVVTTSVFQEYVQTNYGQKWNGSIPFERVIRQLPQFRMAIQVPVYVLGIDI